MKNIMLALGFVAVMMAWGFMHSPYWKNRHIKSMQWDIANVDSDIDHWNEPYSAASIAEMRSVLLPRQHYLAEASATLNKMEATLNGSKVSQSCEQVFVSYIAASRRTIAVESKLVELLNEPPNYRESLEKLKPEETAATAALENALSSINAMSCSETR